MKSTPRREHELEGYTTGLRARLRLADHYDAELRRHHERLREAIVEQEHAV